MPKTFWRFWIRLQDGSAAAFGKPNRFSALCRWISASDWKLFGTFVEFLALSVFSAFPMVLVDTIKAIDVSKSASQLGGKKGQTRLAALWPCISASENKLFGIFPWVFGTCGIFCISGQLVGGCGGTWHGEAR